MSTAMQQFMNSFSPALIPSAESITATYTLYNGDVTLFFDEAAHSYFVRLKGQEEAKKVPSATTITGTLDKPNLIPWAVMVAANEILAKVEKHSYLSDLKVCENGKERQLRLLNPNIRFEEFTEWVKEAKREYKAVSQEALDIGHIAHDWLEELQKTVIRTTFSVKQVWDSNMLDLPVVVPDVKDIDENLKELRLNVASIQTAAVQNCCREAVDWMVVHNFRPLRVENKVYSVNYNVAGTFDTVGLFDSCENGDCCTILNPDGTTYRIVARDLKVLADWKSSKALYNEYRFQLAIYYEAWREEHNEELGGRIVVKMPKNVGDKFAAYFLPNEDQPKDLKAFAGLLAPYQRIEEIDELEWQQKQAAREKAREDKLMRQAEDDLNKMVIRQLRDAERAKKKLDDAAAEAKEAEDKVARRLAACPASGRYQGKKPPNCNEGRGCTACRTKYEAAQAAKEANG